MCVIEIDIPHTTTPAYPHLKTLFGQTCTLWTGGTRTEPGPIDTVVEIQTTEGPWSDQYVAMTWRQSFCSLFFCFVLDTILVSMSSLSSASPIYNATYTRTRYT